jgi:hypothetical protein
VATETVAGERLRRDVKNAEVFAPGVADAPWRRTRVFLTSHRLIVWTADEVGRPSKLLDEPVSGDVPQADRGTLQGGMTLHTARGDVHVTRGGGCGCGSVLNALDAPVGW